MVFNLPGVLVPFNLLFNPRLVVPSLIVKGARCVWTAGDCWDSGIFF